MTFDQFRVLLRLRRPHEPASRLPGRPSSSEVEAGGYGSRRSKRNGHSRVDKRASKRVEHPESQSCDGTILGILHIPIHVSLSATSSTFCTCLVLVLGARTGGTLLLAFVGIS